MLLSMLSALARLDLDPRFEAANLSRLSAAAATERLTSLLSALPTSQFKTPAAGTVKQWVGLLPQSTHETDGSLGAAVEVKSKMSWPLVGLVILAAVMMLAAQLEDRRDSKGLTGGAASPASGATEGSAVQPKRG